jgi:LPPG:FO 2-phospho-L-lactate transferase
VKVVALAGGVGGAKLADGLNQILPPDDLTIIVNSGDDFEHLGLKICPDLDTVCYTLAGLANPVMGWGRADETWNAMANLSLLGGPDWFNLGDKDIGLHLERTRQIKNGQLLSDITSDFCKVWGIGSTILPMSNENVPTIVLTKKGELAFQEYFVKYKCQPEVIGFRFSGIEDSQPPEKAMTALEEANTLIICPSNPWVSIDPILSVPGVKDEIITRKSLQNTSSLTVIAVSPIIGGKAVKGPVVKMYRELNIKPSALSVAQHYGEILDGFVLDHKDKGDESKINDIGINSLVTDSIMRNKQDRKRLAIEIIEFSRQLRNNLE